MIYSGETVPGMIGSPLKLKLCSNAFGRKRNKLIVHYLIFSAMYNVVKVSEQRVELKLLCSGRMNNRAAPSPV